MAISCSRFSPLGDAHKPYQGAWVPAALWIPEFCGWVPWGTAGDGSATHETDQYWIPGSCLCHGQAPALADFWEVNKQMKEYYVSTFQTHKHLKIVRYNCIMLARHLVPLRVCIYLWSHLQNQWMQWVFSCLLPIIISLRILERPTLWLSGLIIACETSIP